MIDSIMDKETEEIVRRVERAKCDLMEICDSFRIFLTRHNSETGHTQHMTFGAGNWYAQEGQVREWANQNDERTRCEVHEENED